MMAAPLKHRLAMSCPANRLGSSRLMACQGIGSRGTVSEGRLPCTHPCIKMDGQD